MIENKNSCSGAVNITDTKYQKKDSDCKQDKAAIRRRRIISIAGLIIFLALSAAISLPVLKYLKEPDTFQELVAGFGMWGWLVCIGAMALQIIIAIIPGGAIEIGAGYAFGTVEATILCTIGSIIGCTIVYWLVKAFGIKFVEAFFPIEKIQNLKFLQNGKKRDIFAFIIFLIPGMPKDLISYFMGFTNIKLSRWLVISTTARLPAVIVSAMGGHALGKGQYLAALIVLAVIVGISIIGTIGYKILCKNHNKKEKK